MESPRRAALRATAIAIAASVCLAAGLALPAGADAARSKSRVAKDAIWVSPRGKDNPEGTRRRPIRSLSLALKVADRLGRRRIYLMPGTHRRFFDDTARRRTVVVSGAPRMRRPRLMGGEIRGGSRLRFRKIAFRGFVLVSSHPTRTWNQVASRITFERSTFTSVPKNINTCIMIRNGSRSIRVRDSRFTDCRYGITGPHDGIDDPRKRLRSRGLRFERNWIGPVRTDAFQFTHWEDVTIRGNVIRRQHDPAGVDHTDGIQITGDSHRVRILDNVVSDGGQLIFTQFAFGQNTDILIRNNLVYGTDNYALKLGGVTGLRVLSNTVWGTRWGGLLVRDNVQGAVIVNNLLDGFGTTHSPEIVQRDHNFIAGTGERPGPGDIVGGDPGLLDPRNLDFRLTASSPLTRAADPGLAPRVGSRFDPRAVGCSLAPVRSVAGRRMKLPACGAPRR